MNVSWIEEKVKTIDAMITQLQATSHRYSTIRFLLVVMFLVCFFEGYFQSSRILYALSALAFCVFVYMVYRHGAIKQHLEDAQLLKESYGDILKRKTQEWKQFADTGSDFMKEDSTQAYDLDVFGKASLYQYLSIAKTPYGRMAFAHALTWQNVDVKEVLLVQQAVKESEEQVENTMEFVQLLKSFEKHGHKRKKKTFDMLFTMLQGEVKKPSFIETLISYALPLVTWIGVFGMVFFDQTYAIFSIGFTLSLCLSLLFTIRNSVILSSVTELYDVMKDYERMFLHVSKQPYKSAYLKKLQQDLQPALSGMQALRRILGVVSLHHNFIMNILLNGFFLMDFHGIRHYKQWQMVYGSQIQTWIETIAEFEHIVSLTQLSFAKENCEFPVFENQEEPRFAFTDMHHPLLLEAQAKTNCFQASNDSYVITGSNMSGKTTFLRTIGLNMILGHAGAKVCASSASMTMMQIYTSMRVQDDVSEGISTFYAEILRIKQMMDESKKKVPMLVLIDEIFKGTNSADRIECAIQAISRLHQPWIITMVSTHDFELCDLQSDPHIQAKNYHFSEYYQDDKICFDYQLKDGRCVTTNAKQLMRLAGFFEE